MSIRSYLRKKTKEYDSKQKTTKKKTPMFSKKLKKFANKPLAKSTPTQKTKQGNVIGGKLPLQDLFRR